MDLHFGWRLKLFVSANLIKLRIFGRLEYASPKYLICAHFLVCYGLFFHSYMQIEYLN